jgi:hypothetical protein
MTRDPSPLIWSVKKGDLVRIKKYQPINHSDEFTYLHGIVISDIKEKSEPDISSQTILWPSVDVYLFSNKQIKTVIPGGLEIISIS